MSSCGSPKEAKRKIKGTVWEPDAAAPPATKPAEALAARIAAQIEHWLDSGTALNSADRPIEPGDILILLRKREPMAGLLQAALKRKGIPVSGADRVALLDELAVMDLISLASVLLQPDDDLALAEVLKSPLFGLSDDDLFELSFGRNTSLWQALEGGAASNGEVRLRRRKTWRMAGPGSALVSVRFLLSYPRSRRRQKGFRGKAWREMLRCS